MTCYGVGEESVGMRGMTCLGVGAGNGQEFYAGIACLVGLLLVTRSDKWEGMSRIGKNVVWP